jgi:redox-sensitive bicupin YhaK (pirin superfamily)
VSQLPDHEPECLRREGAIELVIRGRPRDLGGFSVRRTLPSAQRRLVGPFIFWDHMGPARFEPGGGIDVRPHPHIGLATVTYLFEGEIVHRDNLGSDQAIRPGAVNWMTAGRGIAHSERSSAQARRDGALVHGIQSWVALPRAHEETEPSFHHHGAETLPQRALAGARVRVLVGSAFDETSPARTFSPMFYVDAHLDAGAEIQVPDGYEERAAYLVDGAIACDGAALPLSGGAPAPPIDEGDMAIFRPGASVRLRAVGPSRVMLLGGAPLDGPRHIWWNFVSSSPERIERAKRDWQEGRFGAIPGDDKERIPLPA